MAAAEKKLAAIAVATRRARRPLSDPARINYRIGERCQESCETPPREII
jgi:hypothetical protein